MHCLRGDPVLPSPRVYLERRDVLPAGGEAHEARVGNIAGERVPGDEGDLVATGPQVLGHAEHRVDVAVTGQRAGEDAHGVRRSSLAFRNELHAYRHRFAFGSDEVRNPFAVVVAERRTAVLVEIDIERVVRAPAHAHRQDAMHDRHSSSANGLYDSHLRCRLFGVS